MQTLGAIRIQLYHQCFEQVWQHNFTSIIGLRRSTQRHRSSKVGTSIVDLRKSTHRSSKVDTSIIDLRRSTHRSSKIESGNIAPTTQHRADIPTIRHGILSTTALHNYRYYTQDSAWCIHTVYITLDDGTHAHTSGIYGNDPHTALVMYYTPIYITYMR